MTLESFILSASRQAASDLHLEPGLPAALRIRGGLRMAGDPLPGKLLADLAREVLGAEGWAHFTEKRSADFSRTIGGVRCRFKVWFRGRLIDTIQASRSGFIDRDLESGF